MLVNSINSIRDDSRKAISNRLYERIINLYAEYIKEQYREYLWNDILNIKGLFEDNEKLITSFIETKLNGIFDAYTSFNMGLASLIAFYKYLNKRNILDTEDVEVAVKIISKYKKKPKLLTKEEKYIHITDLHEIVSRSKFWFNKTEKYRPDKYDKAKFKAVLYFIYYTGIRRVELPTLRRLDFDLDKCSVKIKNRICYYPSKVRDMIRIYFNSDEEVKNAFNFTNAVAGRYNKILSRYKFRGQRITLSFLRDSNANMIMHKTKNVGVLMKLHGETSKCYIKKYELKDEDVANIYKKRIHYQERK